LAGVELSEEAERGVKSPFVTAGFVWTVLQSVYASNRSRDITDTSLSAVVNDACHFLLSKVLAIAEQPESVAEQRSIAKRRYGVFGTFSVVIVIVVVIINRNNLTNVSVHVNVQ